MAIGSPQWMYSSGSYELEQSLRYEDGKSPSLEWTPSSNGNRKTWTYSTWFKRGNVNSSATRGMLLSAYENSSNYTYIGFDDGGGGYDRIRVYSLESSIPKIDFESTAQFRDVSGWYHLVVSVDTTQGTSSNRVKIYVNGEQITDWATSTEPSQNYDTVVSKTIRHNIGSYVQSSSFYDGYLAEVNFIDGQQLTPADFGETGTYGEWKPIEYSGTYGTNGFYLPFKQDYTVEGMSTVTYKGNGGTQYIGGTGFQPDLVWIKQRSNADSNVVFDAVRGVHKRLVTDSTPAEADWTSVDKGLDVFSSDGFTVKDDSVGNYSVNRNGGTFVAWNWDMGGSNATNTDGSITSTVRANPTYGQSIVSYTGNATAGATVGHGLSSAPEMIIHKNRSAVDDWSTWHTELGTGKKLFLNGSNASSNTSNYPTLPTSSLFYVGAGVEVNGSGNNMIAYCFHSVTGYSKIGSYTGSGSGGSPTITIGFKPAFFLVKNASAVDNWRLYDNTRTTNLGETILYPNLSVAEDSSSDSANWHYTVTDTTITPKGNNNNASGNTFIYMAFADTREYAYWLDQSGNNNDWTSNNLTESDISVDSPTNNFATLNPLEEDSTTTTFSEGNLQATIPVSASTGEAYSTIAQSSGKWYWEVYYKSRTATGDFLQLGLQTTDESKLYHIRGSDGERWDNGSPSAGTSTRYTTGDVISVAVDLDNGKWYIATNNTWQDAGNGTGNPTSGTGQVHSSLSGEFEFFAGNASGSGNHIFVANFGQDSSFAGNKTAQGNQDSNGIGDFYYTPPTGFLALCTKNLPDVDVVPSEHFNTVLYSGTGSNQDITGVGFSPAFVWAKDRTLAASHMLTDKVRGIYKTMNSNSTESESSLVTALRSFNSDGFSVGSNANINDNGSNYVAWNWKANGSGSSNTNGSITSTVSANTDAGFSVVSYTGGGAAATIGHGLSSAPEMVVVKRRESGGWIVGHESAGWGYRMNFESTAAKALASWAWNDTAPTSSVFSVGSDNDLSALGGTYIAYCFHSVDGYSKVGSYTGNNNADGVFIWTGFRPAWVMVKRTDNAENWVLYDNLRAGYNADNDYVLPNSSVAEYTGYKTIDLTSNGFKLRTTHSDKNASGTYIYLCFAETPFKYSNAR